MATLEEAFATYATTGFRKSCLFSLIRNAVWRGDPQRPTAEIYALAIAHYSTVNNGGYRSRAPNLYDWHHDDNAAEQLVREWVGRVKATRLKKYLRFYRQWVSYG